MSCDLINVSGEKVEFCGQMVTSLFELNYLLQPGARNAVTVRQFQFDFESKD